MPNNSFFTIKFGQRIINKTVRIPCMVLVAVIVLASCKRDDSKECDYINDYFSYVNRAELELLKNNHAKAYHLYEDAFTNCQPVDLYTHHGMQDYARVCVELKRYDEAAEILISEVIDGGNINGFISDGKFKKVFETSRGEWLIKNLDSIKSKFLDGIRWDLRKELQAMIASDQRYNMTSKQDSVFMANSARLMAIFEREGFPGRKTIGNFALDGISADPTILLLHTADSIRQAYFIPKLTGFVKQGRCHPQILAMVVDNLEIFNGNPQPYGTYQLKSNNGDRKSFTSQVINRNRKSLGLLSMAEQQERDSLIRVQLESPQME